MQGLICSNKASFDFAGANVVVTGGAQGIGLSIAEDFLRSGARVSIWDLNQEGLDKAQAHLRPYESSLELLPVDVACMKSCLDAANKLNLPLHVLVNNAGITRDKTLAKMEEQDFDSVIAVNLKGTFNATKALLDNFSKEPRSNRIINMASVVAANGNFGQTNYVAAKAGIVGLTKSLARELGPKGFTVNAIAPGFIDTDMVKAIPEQARRQIGARIPVRRLGEAADIANACLFLASEGASYVNGAVLSVDGGLVA